MTENSITNVTYLFVNKICTMMGKCFRSLSSSFTYDFVCMFSLRKVIGPTWARPQPDGLLRPCKVANQTHAPLRTPTREGAVRPNPPPPSILAYRRRLDHLLTSYCLHKLVTCTKLWITDQILCFSRCYYDAIFPTIGTTVYSQLYEFKCSCYT